MFKNRKILAMFTERSRLFLCTASLALGFGCAEAKFKGEGSGNRAQGQPAVSSNSKAQPSRAQNGCIENGMANFTYPEDIEKCRKGGNLYDFDNGACTPIIKAQFACDFNTVRNELLSRKFATAEVDQAMQNNANPIGCGQSPDGKTVVVQWWEGKPSSQTSCQFEQGHTNIVTGCYRIYSSSPPGLPTTPEQHKAFVRQCMSENQGAP